MCITETPLFSLDTRTVYTHTHTYTTLGPSFTVLQQIFATDVVLFLYECIVQMHYGACGGGRDSGWRVSCTTQVDV